MPRFISTSIIVAAFALLANLNIVCSAVFTDDSGVARRTLSQGIFEYSWEPGCCSTSSTACNEGPMNVYIAATASTGNSYSASLSEYTNVFPTQFNGKQHCDSGGIICWSGTQVGDTEANICVYYANDQICGNTEVVFSASSGGAECVQQAAIAVIL